MLKQTLSARRLVVAPTRTSFLLRKSRRRGSFPLSGTSQTLNHLQRILITMPPLFWKEVPMTTDPNSAWTIWTDLAISWGVSVERGQKIGCKLSSCVTHTNSGWIIVESPSIHRIHRLVDVQKTKSRDLILPNLSKPWEFGFHGSTH